MQRIFQHYQGEVKGLLGKNLDSLFSVNESNDIILLWAQDKSIGVWWRIFIDGVYCGIDEYSSCNIHEDLDEEVVQVDYSPQLKPGKIGKANVDTGSKHGHITLSITLGQLSSEAQRIDFICQSEEGDCTLNFTSLNKPH